MGFSHHQQAAVATAAEQDVETLRAAGVMVEITSREPEYWRASVREGEVESKFEWACDSTLRFFPMEPDVEVGWRLSFWDVATSTALELAGRERLRTKLDCLYLHQFHLAFGALAWAASAKNPAMTPEMISALAMRFGRIPAEKSEWLNVGMPLPPAPPVIKRKFMEMNESAQLLFSRLPPEEIGCLYLDPHTQRPVCPDPDSAEFPTLIRHYGRLWGAWPEVVS